MINSNNVCTIFIIALILSITGFCISNKHLFNQLKRNKDFYCAARRNWLGDGAILGHALSQLFEEYQPITVYYPVIQKNYTINKAPFRYINFKGKPYYYVYPGRFIQNNYDYMIKPEIYQKFLSMKGSIFPGRYQRFFIIMPTENSSKTEFYMRKYGKISLVVPKGVK